MRSPSDRLFIAIYTDEDVPRLLAVLLRERGFEASSAAEWETWGTTDEDQLVLATERGHALLTFNRDDFIALAQAWSQEGREHAGIVISQQHGLKTIGELVRQVSNLLDAVTADEMWNTVRYLQSYR